MKIAYDHQIFTMQDCGGVSRYFFEILGQFRRLGSAEFELWLRFSNNIYLEGAEFSRHRHFLPGRRFRGKARILDQLNKFVSRKGLAAGNFDVFHPTYFDPYFLKHIGDKPFVLTIHDMTHEIYPDHFALRQKTSGWKKIVAAKASRILADSHNTKRDITRLLGIDEDRIDVVYFASSFERPPDGGRAAGAPGLPGRFILFVGNRFACKNFEAFGRGVAPLLKDKPDLRVVCAGGGPFGKEERVFLHGIGIEGRVLQRAVDDRTLASLYAAAEVFVYPSLYEGFGIPILEAFACGCPVALSRASSFPEVAGDAGLYFDPKDETSIRETIARVLDDRELRETLRARGAARSKDFSWAKTAEGVLAAYRKAAPGRM
jgi:glycosyltransferase involved in cell wall biosynthesis